MNIQETIETLKKQNPHLHIEKLYTDGSEIGYLRVSLDDPDTRANHMAGKVPELFLRRSLDTGHSEEDARGIVNAAIYMNSHLSENTKQEDLAKIAHMSPAKFKYMFRDLMQCSLREYRTKLRLKRACMLLIKTYLTTEEVAREVGYKKTASFISFFREHMQMSPQEYRNKRSDLRQLRRQ